MSKYNPVRKRSHWYNEYHEPLYNFLERAKMSHQEISKWYEIYKYRASSTARRCEYGWYAQEFCKNFRNYVSSKKPYSIHNEGVLFVSWTPWEEFPQRRYVLKNKLVAYRED